MLLVADVHGAARALRRVAAAGETLLVLGDLINFLDYRTMSGILTELTGRDWVEELVRLREEERFAELGARWAEMRRGREKELRARHRRLVEDAYVEVCDALRGVDSYVTFGNVDWPDVLAATLPPEARFVPAGVVELEGLVVGIAGGGLESRLRVPGEVREVEMAETLEALGPVDVLCTHVPPAVEPLQRDVVAGTRKGSQAVLDYLLRHRPDYHYFGDIHQPQAVSWRVGDTRCRNVGYFRATGRAVRHHP